QELLPRRAGLIMEETLRRDPLACNNLRRSFLRVNRGNGEEGVGRWGLLSAECGARSGGAEVWARTLNRAHSCLKLNPDGERAAGVDRVRPPRKSAGSGRVNRLRRRAAAQNGIRSWSSG